MVDCEKWNPVEQVLLLGFIPVLGASSHVGAALVAIVIGVCTALVIRAVAMRIPARMGESTRWTVLFAVGLALPYGLVLLAEFAVPLPAAVRVPLALVGAAPLVYAGVAGPGRPPRTQGLLWRYVVIMLGLGIAREGLGHGTLLGQPLMVDGAVPFGILATPAGALLLAAALAWLSRYPGFRRASRREVVTS